MKIIPPQTGTSFIIRKGQTLKVTDIKGQQVSDMVLFSEEDTREKLSAGKTMDFEESILLSTSNFLWSNRGNKLMHIKKDTNGRNDILLAPCSQQTFEIMYGIKERHPSCFNNLKINLEKFGIMADAIPTAFNIFMNVQFNESGKISVKAPTTDAGDYVEFIALRNLVVGLTACSAPDSNGGTFKEIGYEIL